MNNQTETPEAPFSIREQLNQVEEYFKQHGSNASGLVKGREDRAEMAFAISLKSKTVSRCWAGVEANLARTLRSIFGNTDQNFRILIAGHEKPEIEEIQDERVTWIPVNFPPPEGPGQFSRDKMKKRKLIGVYLKETGYSGYLMPLDADDWIHHRFVEFIRSHPVSEAFVINRGVMVNLAIKEAWLRNRFYRGCGSSAVYYFSNDDFPLGIKHKDLEETPFYLVVKRHMKVIEHLDEINKHYVMVDLPFVTWVLGHGDNNSMIKGKKDNGISAKHYKANGEKLEDWFYDYFMINANSLKI